MVLGDKAKILNVQSSRHRRFQHTLHSLLLLVDRRKLSAQLCQSGSMLSNCSCVISQFLLNALLPVHCEMTPAIDDFNATYSFLWPWRWLTKESIGRGLISLYNDRIINDDLPLVKQPGLQGYVAVSESPGTFSMPPAFGSSFRVDLQGILKNMLTMFNQRLHRLSIK